MRDVLIYNRALSAQEIKRLAEGASPLELRWQSKSFRFAAVEPPSEKRIILVT
jgi:hypothetical protein